MTALGFAWRSLVRQPARAALGILGVAAVGALLFDMLMLSRGLIVSMQDLLDRGGWDVRVSAGDLPASGLRVANALQTAEAIATPQRCAGERAPGCRTLCRFSLMSLAASGIAARSSSTALIVRPP